jgi:hypothetical protein
LGAQPQIQRFDARPGCGAPAKNFCIRSAAPLQASADAENFLFGALRRHAAS